MSGVRCASCLLLLGGCVAACDVVPRAPVDVRAADVVTITLATPDGRLQVCPGRPVQLDIHVVARLPGYAEPVHLSLHRRDLDDWIVDPRSLGLSSLQGTVDDDVVFHPDADPRVSASTGFVIHMNVPRGPLVGVQLAPSYDCARELAFVPPAAAPGEAGEAGLSGYAIDALRGEQGGQGGAGLDGFTESVWVTRVRTPFFPDLVAVLAEGDRDGFLLAPPGQPLVLRARGGNGGSGGAGGEGGAAFSTLDCDPHRGRGRHPGRGKDPKAGCYFPARNPGDGGEGGPGGPGGRGGHVVVHVDRRFPELLSWLSVDVRGGPGGDGGPPGRGGDSASSFGYADGAHGHGAPGRTGPTGAIGPDGTGEILLDESPPRHFGGLGHIQVL